MSGGLDSTTALTALRQWLSDTDSGGSGRWTDSTLLGFLDRANKRLVRDVMFPDCRVVQVTVPGVQLYQFPLMIKTKAVYVAGQLLVPSDLPTLEGRQVGSWNSGSQNLPGAYSDAAGGTTATSAPTWAVAEPLSYPATDGQWVTPAPDAQSWELGQRARYYWRGGWLGLVPAPANVCEITIDGVRQPDTITKVGQALTVPENFLDAILWGAIKIAKFADDGQQSDRAMQVAEQNYQSEKRALITWRGEFPGEQRDGPKPSVLRPVFSQFRKRTSRSGCR